ncbi:family 20 glycosylhydrolase, partial [Rhizobiaceae sp. 2RAB30]
TVAVAWQHPDRAHERASRGYDVVLAPGNAYYLDMASTEDWQVSGNHWAGVVSLERTYAVEADLGWPKDVLAKLRGVHACIWGEYMHDRRNFDTLVFPRIF